MIELTYKDAYDVVRTQTFDDPNDFSRMLVGCLTVPDYYPVTSVTYKGKDVGYKGTFGDLFKTFNEFDWSQFED